MSTLRYYYRKEKLQSTRNISREAVLAGSSSHGQLTGKYTTGRIRNVYGIYCETQMTDRDRPDLPAIVLLKYDNVSLHNQIPQSNAT
jgi:hypothetical protein